MGSGTPSGIGTDSSTGAPVYLTDPNAVASKAGQEAQKGAEIGPQNKKWNAQIRIEHTNFNLGFFSNERDAAFVYDRAAILVFGEFAHTNFPAHESEHVILPEYMLQKITALQMTTE